MLLTIRFYLSHLLDEWRVLKSMRPQNESSIVLIEAHRLEKSMCLPNQAAGRGFDRAIGLLRTIDRLYSRQSAANDAQARFALETGLASIRQFIAFKQKIGGNEEGLNKLIRCYDSSSVKELPVKPEGGGTVRVKKEDFSASLPLITRLFTSRHSIRTFSGEVDLEALRQAIQLALTVPSACNRQPSHLYIIDDDKLAAALKADRANDYGASKHLFVTADSSAYDVYEFNDWTVSASLFAGYLTLALHAYGIGCCIMRKSLSDSDPHNRLIRKVCSIPEREKIVLELLIGNCPSEFTAPVSRRQSFDEAVTTV